MVLLVMLAEGSIQLVPDGSIFFHIALVLVMIAVLNRTLFAPISKILAEREAMGKGALGQAIEVEQRAEESDRQYREALRTARTAGYQGMQAKRAADLQERERELETVRSEMESRIKAERDAIEREAERARGQVDSAALAREIRDRVLGPVQNAGR